MTAAADEVFTDAPRFDCRDSIAATMIELAEADERVCAVANDSVGSSKLGGFGERFPDRLINVGIAEQNMVGIAAGLANGGMMPYVFGASCFVTGRALEQIKVDLAYSAANVTVVGVSSGMAYGELGPTHHSIEDLAWLRAIFGLNVVVPADPIETAQALRRAHDSDGPCFIRTSRIPVPRVNPSDAAFEVGRAIRLRDGGDVTIIANGVVVERAVAAAGLLATDGIESRVLNLAWLSPFDHEAVLDAARTTGAIVTVEEASVRGGLGGAVAECVVAGHPVPVRSLGVTRFAPTGSAPWLLDHFGLDALGIAEAARQLIAGRS
ncbi:MAG: transketolase C-terminal domain-containing protein [Ilumatobacteraceae bacterium]|nr:transketolase C-terminal domain-containing protein [Ilumatobacteraceae bacterium]